MRALLIVGSCMPMTPASGASVAELPAPMIGVKWPRPDSTLALCAPKRVCRARDSPEAEAAARSAYRILCVRLDARV